MKTPMLLFALLAILATSAVAQPQFPFTRYIGYRLPRLFPNPSFPFPQPNKPATPPAQPAASGQNPVIPPGMTGDQQRCFEALHDNRIGSCIQDIVNVFVTHQMSVSSECCSLLTTCRPAAPYQQSPFLEQLITQYCS